MASNRQAEPPVHGFLNLYKPAGITSMAALRRVKRATGQRRKVGHAGTIDPLAEGVLPICFGQATRLMEDVVSGRKRYRMTMRLGATSTTYDAEGDITESAYSVELTRREIETALVNFVGRIEQVPPMYSAIKVDGRRLYELARAGKEVERAPRPVQVYEIHIDEISLPYLRLTVDCGKGTYLRSIAHDLGQALGCGGYVTELCRLSCGRFKAEHGVTLEGLEDSAAEGDWRVHLQPVDWALRDYPALRVTSDQATAIKHGQAILPVGDAAAGPEAPGMRRAYDPDGVFLALLQFQGETDRWQPRRVFQGSDVSPYAPSPSNARPRPAGV
ncbi:MAG: tRNA pseudouridine(55) synthase TruB [Chloroflexota bacterium]|nr:tRNA pseudouridine(55) synthase TruB [Chloroflexota bacterium]